MKQDPGNAQELYLGSPTRLLPSPVSIVSTPISEAGLCVQVILKPDPGNAQELYLGSLQALGISTRDQDVRFVEDDWKSPALGANGLGWEVWLNGQVCFYPGS